MVVRGDPVMAEVFKSQEVYKHVNYDLHDRNEMIAVRGVYVASEYRPPYYNEPVLGLRYIQNIPAKIDDFQDVSTTNGEDPMYKMLDFLITDFPITPTFYTVDSKSAGEDSMYKMLDLLLTSIQPTCEFYETKSQSAGEDAMYKMLDLSFTLLQPTEIPYGSAYKNSTPEYGIGLSFFRTDSAIIENYVP